MGFLKAILVLLLVYYLLKILFRMFAPRLFSYAAKKTEAHFRERFDGFTTQAKQQEESIGDVTIDKKPSKKFRSSKKVGEYIDFEEID